MEPGPVSVSMDFYCSQLSVWSTIISSALYQKWNPARGDADHLSTSGDFTLGSKIQTESGQTTGIVSEFRAPARFTVLFGQRSESIQLASADFGCRVTLQVADASCDQAELLEWADRTILSLKELTYGNLPDTRVQPRIFQARKSGRFQSIVTGILQGYRSPLTPHASLMDGSDQMSDIIDHTDGDVIVHLRAALAALMCTVLLFITISFTSTFPRIDVVPSSGMSLYESDDVNKENAFRIVMGMYKSDLELMTNCLGQQLSITEYSYISTSRTPEGYPNCQLLISYDAYSRVRTVRFLDNALASSRLQLHLSDLRPLLSSTMSVQEMEEVVGHPLSGFILDKSGVTRVFFGVVERNEFFSSIQGVASSFNLFTRSELVIETEIQWDTIGIEYNYPYDRLNTLPYNEIPDKLRRQYSNYLVNYRNDRAAYERIFFLFAKTQTEVEIVLGPAAGYTIGDDLNSTGVYPLSSPDSGYDWYYVYEVGYSNISTVSSVVLHNRLLENKGDTLLAPEQYSFRAGMHLYDFYAEMGILPSYASITAEHLILGYGCRVNQQVNPMMSYEMCFRFFIAPDPLDLSLYQLDAFQINT